MTYQYLQEFLQLFHDGLLVVVHGPATLLRVILALGELKEDVLETLDVVAAVRLARGGGGVLSLQRQWNRSISFLRFGNSTYVILTVLHVYPL